MNKPWLPRGIRIGGGEGLAPTTSYTVLFSGQGASSSPCQGCPSMNQGETWTIEDQNRQQVRMDMEAGSLTGQA